MKSIDISGSVRQEVGKKATKAARKEGCVPCVLYGELKGDDGNPRSVHFTALRKELDRVVFTPDIYVVNINLDGTVHQAVVKEVQYHPVKDTITHMDFYEIVPQKVISIDIPVQPTGLAEGVRAGGKLMTLVRKLKVKAPWESIPEKLVFDVSSLGLAQRIKVGDLSFPGLELVTPKEVIVCSVKMTRAAMGAAAAAAKAGE